MLLLVYTLLLNAFTSSLIGLFRPLPRFIHTSYFKYQVPTSIICVDKSDGTRKDVFVVSRSQTAFSSFISGWEEKGLVTLHLLQNLQNLGIVDS